MAGYALNTHTPLTHRSWSGLTMPLAECGNLSRNELTRNSSGTTRLPSSQLAEPLWTAPSLKSGISLRELISTLKKKKKKKKKRIKRRRRGGGNELSNILPKSSHTGEKATTITPLDLSLTLLGCSTLPLLPILTLFQSRRTVAWIWSESGWRATSPS